MSLRPNAGVIQINLVGAAQLSPCPVNPLRVSGYNTKANIIVGSGICFLNGKNITDVVQIAQLQFLHTSN